MSIHKSGQTLSGPDTFHLVTGRRTGTGGAGSTCIEGGMCGGLQDVFPTTVGGVEWLVVVETVVVLGERGLEVPRL